MQNEEFPFISGYGLPVSAWPSQDGLRQEECHSRENGNPMKYLSSRKWGKDFGFRIKCGITRKWYFAHIIYLNYTYIKNTKILLSILFTMTGLL